MIQDIIQDTQLAVMQVWSSVIDAVAPKVEKREAIRLGMARVNHARGLYRELDKMLVSEARDLKVTHLEQKKQLNEKQTNEVKAMSLRHKEVRLGASEQVRKTRAGVISDIYGAASVTPTSETPEAVLA